MVEAEHNGAEEIAHCLRNHHLLALFTQSCLQQVLHGVAANEARMERRTTCSAAGG